MKPRRILIIISGLLTLLLLQDVLLQVQLDGQVHRRETAQFIFLTDSYLR